MKHLLALPPSLDIIRSAAEPVITINATHHIVMFNSAAEQLFQRDAGQMIGKTMAPLVPARFRKAQADHITQFQAAGLSERSLGPGTPLWGLKANGDEFPMEASISRTESSSGVYFSVFLRDITRQRQIEQALFSSRGQLKRLSNALLREREQEKRHMARELHDDIGQSLTALTLELSQLEAALPSCPADASEYIDAMRRLIKTAFTSLRRIVSDLRPALLDDLGLPAAVQCLASDMMSRHGIDVETRIDAGGRELPIVVATVLFRVSQEALTNIAKHAHASRVLLDLRCTRTQCILTVRDDGVGTTPEHLAKALQNRLGLLGMRERVRLLNGSMSVHTSPGKGLRLEVLVPLMQPAPA